MIRPLFSSVSIAGGLLLGACGLFSDPMQDSGPLPPKRGDVSSPRQLTQLGFGRAAHYAVCRDIDCPTVTPKTLAPVATAATQPVDARGISAAAAVPVSPAPPPSGVRQ